ncbi:MAG: hypothetical protein ABIS69_02530 [Sediminibacterium sp.]
MKLLRCFFMLIIGMMGCILANAQNPLPELSVKELTRGKIQVSWYSPEKNCIQLAVQRSLDSNKNFRTIFSAQSPELANNGFVDNRPPIGKAYYRIFYVIEGGAYFFTRAIMVETLPAPMPVNQALFPEMEKPKDLTNIYLKKQFLFRLTKPEYQHFKDSLTKTKDVLHRMDQFSVEWRPAPKPVDTRDIVRIYQKDMLVAELDRKAYQLFRDSIKENTKDTLYAIDPQRVQIRTFIPIQKSVFIYRNDSLLQQVDLFVYRRFRDSVSTRTKDTLFAKDNNRVEIHSFQPKYAWRPSQFIFTNSKGYVTVILPLANRHKYHIIFFEEDGSEVFRIKTVKETEFILDKTDFVHAGWFSFELFEDEKLKERNKFFITRE